MQNASGRLVGPAVAGVLYAGVGPASCFLLNAASYLIILVALVRIRPSELIARPRKLATGALSELRAGLAYVRRAPAVRAPLVCAAAMGVMTFNFLTVIPAMITFTFHAGGRAFGLCEALNAGAAVLGGLWIAPRLGNPTRRHLALGCGLFTVAMLGNALMPTLVWFAIWMPIFGVCFIIFQSTITALLQTRSEPAYLGRVMSLYTLGIFGTTPLGAIGTGWLIDQYSPRVAMGVGAIATLGSGLWLWLVTPVEGPLVDPPALAVR